MPRIFIHEGDVTGNRVTLPEAEARRLSRVLRLKPGDHVTLFDGRLEYASRIETITPKSAVLEITASVEKRAEPGIEITLGQGVPKGDRLEWVVQKAVELGVFAVVPVVMDRSVKRPEGSGAHKSIARLGKIATEAAQQSGRLSVPEVHAYTDLDGFISLTRDAGLKVVMFEGEPVRSLRNVLEDAGHGGRVALLVGPEGGLTEGEVAKAREAGFEVAGLGPRILRTETAGLAALAIIQYELGDVG